MQSKANAIVITPTLNERENIGQHVHDVFEAVSGISMLVVDDGSGDGTAGEVERLRRGNPRLHLLVREGKPSFGASYRDGFRWALDQGFDLLISMDADRSHPASTIPELVEAAETADVVVASRYVQGVSVRNWPLRRVLLSAVANGYARAITSIPCSDLTSGFCLYRAPSARTVVEGALFASGYASLIEMKYRAWRAGARIREVPYTFVERRVGTSKMSGRRLLEGVVAPVFCRLALGRPSRAVRNRDFAGDDGLTKRHG